MQEKEKLDIALLIGSNLKPSFDMSKEIAKNLVTKYDASSILKNTRFSVISYGGEPKLLKPFDRVDSKLSIMELISNLKHQGGTSDLQKALKYVRSNVFGDCTKDEACIVPTKTFIVFTDKPMDETSISLVKQLGESGVKVVVMVVSDALKKSDVDIQGLNINVQIHGTGDGSDGGVIDNIIDLIETGKLLLRSSGYICL